MSGSRPRNEGLVRVLSMLRMFEARGRYTLAELAAGFNVTTRTIRRDLVLLQGAGYPICHEERDADGNWWLLQR